MRGERRRYFRLDISVAPERLRRIDARGHILGAVEAELCEVSGGGARLRVTSCHLAPGHRVELRFALAELSFELTAGVAWVDRESADVVALVGVSFEDVNPELRRRIVAAMNEHRRLHEPQLAKAARRLR